MFNQRSLPKSQHNNHIHNCMRRELARERNHIWSEVHYCYHCFEWAVGDEWEYHCQSHLSSMFSKQCGSITYRHTLLRPAYCPFCLKKKEGPAMEKWQSWTRDCKLWDHLDGHLKQLHWPFWCPHPLCDHQLQDITALGFHFIDEHGLQWPPPRIISLDRRQPDALRRPNRKRKCSSVAEENQCLVKVAWSGIKAASPRPQERLDDANPTISPSLLSTFEDQIAGHTFQLQTASIDNPRASMGTNVDGSNSLTSMGLYESHDEWQLPIDDQSAHLSDTLFSEYLRSRSPSSLSVKAPKDSVEPNLELDTDHGDTAVQADLPVKSVRLRLKPPTVKITLNVTRAKRGAKGRRRGTRGSK